MTRRVTRLVLIWVVTAVAVTVWVTTQAPDVPAGDALLLGAVTATVLSAVLARAGRK